MWKRPGTDLLHIKKNPNTSSHLNVARRSRRCKILLCKSRKVDTVLGFPRNMDHSNIRLPGTTESREELLADLKKQRSIFIHGGEMRDTAAKASYLNANKIASALKPYSESEFVKKCVWQRGFQRLLEMWTSDLWTKGGNLLHFRLQLMRARTLHMFLS